MVFFTVQVLLHSYPRAKSQEKEPVIIKRLWIRAHCPSKCGLISRDRVHRKSARISPMLLARPPYLIPPLNTRITGYLAMVILQALQESGIRHGVKTVAMISETKVSSNLYWSIYSCRWQEGMTSKPNQKKIENIPKANKVLFSFSHTPREPQGL